MSERSPIDKRRERECGVYCRHLLGCVPSDYVVDKYSAFHAQRSWLDGGKGPFDRFLLVVSRVAPWTAALADSYSSRFYKTSTLRTKLVVLLAILECSPQVFQAVDSVDRGGPVLVGARLLGRGMIYGISLVLATVALGPVHAALRLWAVAGGGRAA